MKLAQWDEWSSWTECNNPEYTNHGCDMGYQKSTRNCDDTNTGGLTCTGRATRIQLCNVENESCKCGNGIISPRITGGKENFLGITTDCGSLTGTCDCYCNFSASNKWLSQPRYGWPCDLDGTAEHAIHKRCSDHCRSSANSTKSKAKKILTDHLSTLNEKCGTEWDCDGSNYQQVFASHIGRY